jgi:hypothetical protein
LQNDGQKEQEKANKRGRLDCNAVTVRTEESIEADRVHNGEPLHKDVLQLREGPPLTQHIKVSAIERHGTQQHPRISSGVEHIELRTRARRRWWWC